MTGCHRALSGKDFIVNGSDPAPGLSEADQQLQRDGRGCHRSDRILWNGWTTLLPSCPAALASSKKVLKIDAQRLERHVAQPREQHRLRVLEGLSERGVHRLLDEAIWCLHPVAHGEKRRTAQRLVNIAQGNPR